MRSICLVKFLVTLGSAVEFLKRLTSFSAVRYSLSCVENLCASSSVQELAQTPHCARSDFHRIKIEIKLTDIAVEFPVDPGSTARPRHS